MNIFLYVIIFIIGTVFGSFYTLAIYRIPKKIDIVYKHSFCPNCGHKLEFFELIPILSYIFLGGKCKKCKQKIRPRYFLLEIFSGLTFVFIAYCIKIDVYDLDINVLIRFFFIVLYLVAIYIIAGIDKEYRKIEKSVLYYGMTISCCYIIYLCILGQTDIYRYVMYLITLIILLSLDNIKQKRQAKESYLIEVLILIVIMFINTGELTTIATCILTILLILIYTIKNNLDKLKKGKIETKKLYTFGYLLGLTNVILFIAKLLIIKL